MAKTPKGLIFGLGIIAAIAASLIVCDLLAALPASPPKCHGSPVRGETGTRRPPTAGFKIPNDSVELEKGGRDCLEESSSAR